MGGISQIGKEVVTFHNLFKISSSRDIKRLSLILTWKSESMIARSHQWIQYDHKKAYGPLLLQTFWTFSQLKVKYPSVC